MYCTILSRIPPPSLFFSFFWTSRLGYSHRTEYVYKKIKKQTNKSFKIRRAFFLRKVKTLISFTIIQKLKYRRYEWLYGICIFIYADTLGSYAVFWSFLGCMGMLVWKWRGEVCGREVGVVERDEGGGVGKGVLWWGLDGLRVWGGGLGGLRWGRVFSCGEREREREGRESGGRRRGVGGEEREQAVK